MKKKIIKFIAKVLKIDIYFERPYTYEVVQTNLTPLRLRKVAEMTCEDEYHQYAKHIKEDNEMAIFRELVGKGLIKHKVDGFIGRTRVNSELVLYTTICDCEVPQFNYPEMEWCDKCNGKINKK